MITSTITRPTAITPTSSCDRKIYLIETVDVAPFSQPKQRVISLKPISKSKKVKPSAKVLTPPSTRLSLSRTASSSHSGTADNRSSTEAPIPDQSLHSPTVSEMGARSVISSARSSRPEPVLASVKDSDAQSSETSIADRTITATIELQRAGCLPGDLLPIKISINHTKPIKSLEGVVVTLYRQGRVDTHPPIPIGSTGKGKSDEYYPKSRTGLGGLSFSSAGSSGVFRKDLAQTFAPLIVDPYTLTAVVKPSVRVPEDAFPTISSVPGAMISFKYYVEVIVDLRGKLAAERDSILPRLGITSAPSGSASSSHVLRRDENGAREVVSTIGGSLLDTDQIRREKSVVACLFEVIVGTRDSRRKRIQRVDWPQQPDYEGFTPAPSNDVRLPDNGEDYYFRESYDGPQNLGPSIGSGQPSQQYIPQHDPPPHMEAVPPPILEDEENLDEKTRMQRAEQRLLPSQPPIEDDGSPASAGHHPSAPEPIGDLNMDNSIYREGYGGPGTATYTHGGLSTPATNNTPFGNSQDQYGNSSDNGLAPDLGTPRPTDDKQELERRRLQVEASAPEDFPDDEETGLQGASANRASFTGFEPSAPVLPEEEYTPHSMDRLRHEAHYEQHSLTSESLPRYER